MSASGLTGTYVFLFFFAFGFLIAGKRPLLALSTRIVLIALFGLALGYALTPQRPEHGLLGVATLVANVLFVAFAAIDFVAWQKRRAGGEFS